jgi:hypothetical protein
VVGEAGSSDARSRARTRRTPRGKP